MTDMQSDAAPPTSEHRAHVGRKALIVLAVLTAICSVSLLVRTKSPEAPQAAVVHSQVATDVTEAAAYAAASPNTVEIKNYAFAPAAVTVPLGTTVTWVNEDTVPHTVTQKSGPAKFDSGQIASGGSWSATFATAGTYDYFCADHPQMVARITVTGGSGGGTPPPPSTSSPAPPTSPPPSSPPTTPPTTHPTTPSSVPPTPSGSSSGAPSGTPSTPPSTPPTSSSMSMPGPPTGSGGQCGVNQALTTLVQHIDTAHLGESPGQQIQDLTNLNQYVLSHTTLVANLLTPLLGSATSAADTTLGTLIQHIDTAHLGESPGQQVQDLLNLDQYVLSHTTLVANLLAPAEGLLVGSC
jgi:plastocyanin